MAPGRRSRKGDFTDAADIRWLHATAEGGANTVSKGQVSRGAGPRQNGAGQGGKYAGQLPSKCAREEATSSRSKSTEGGPYAKQDP